MSKLDFSLLLNRLIDQSELSKKTLAHKAGISRSNLYNLINGDVDEVKLSTIIKLASALNLHPLELLRPYFNVQAFDGEVAQLNAGLGTGFLGDVTYPDYSLVNTNQKFEKIWSVANTGDVAWENLFLECQDQQIDINGQGVGLTPKNQRIPIPFTPPGERALLAVEFTAPNLPCTVKSEWKAVNHNGDYVLPNKHPLYCIVKVVGL